MSFYNHEVVQSVNVISMRLPELVDPLEFDRINESMLALLDGKAGQPWILDLSSVTYLGSAMLGLMVNIRQRVKAAGGKLVLCCMAPRLHEVFRACSMERLFNIARTRAEAMKLLAR